MQNQQLGSPSLKKHLRTLSRSRPSSARFNRKSSSQNSLDQETMASTQQVDMAFAKIKSQLVSFSHFKSSVGKYVARAISVQFLSGTIAAKC